MPKHPQCSSQENFFLVDRRYINKVDVYKKKKLSMDLLINDGDHVETHPPALSENAKRTLNC